MFRKLRPIPHPLRCPSCGNSFPITEAGSHLRDHRRVRCACGYDLTPEAWAFFDAHPGLSAGGETWSDGLGGTTPVGRKKGRKHHPKGIQDKFFSLDYFADIPVAERRVLQVLQQRLGEIIPRVGEVGHRSFGFQVDDGHVVALGLYQKGLVDLPECVGALSFLRGFYAAHNELWKLPLSMGYLGNLQTLDVRSNRLWAIHPSIQNLASLQNIDIVGNPVASNRQRSTEEIAFDSPDYYRRYFGFDAEAEKIPMPGGYRYEAWFPLENDPSLHQLGVRIGARVYVYDNVPIHAVPDGQAGRIRNRIVFSRAEVGESEVLCVHTAVGAMPVGEWAEQDWDDPDQVVEWAQNLENTKLDLSPEDHFLSLRSFVQGVAEMGLGTMMASSYYSETVNPQTLPFGFNAAMHAQVSRCLAAIAPSAMQAMIRDLFLIIAEEVPVDWFLSRLDFLIGTYPEGVVEETLFGDLDTFCMFDELLNSFEFRDRALKSPHAAAEVLDHLS